MQVVAVDSCYYLLEVLMADNTLDTCLKKSFSNTLAKSLPKRHNKRKFCGYHYVPSESEEADTLKDKFWRDLDQGKLNFLNTVDMYTRVKQLGKLTEVDCFTTTYQDPALPSDNAPVTCSQSSMHLSSIIGSLTSARDASPPSSSGYESSSIPSIGSVSVTDSPMESDLHLGGLCDMFTNVAQSNDSLLRRKRKRTDKCIWKNSLRSKCRKRQTASRNTSNRKKTVNNKFFRYVDAASEEADTLKDKFWRDLELGNVSAITTADLYSSVKVSRRTRQLSLFSVRNSDQTKDLTEVVATHRKDSQANQSSYCTGLTDVDVKCFEADDSRKTGLGTSDERNDFYISEQTASIADCKLLSPCSVSVERLPFSIDDVDLLAAGTADMCSSITTVNSSCTNVETESDLVKEDCSFVLSDMSVNMACKRHWHSGRCRTGMRNLNKGAHTVECISGRNAHVKCVHLSSLEINRSLPVCHVPVAYPSTCQQNFLCGWLEDEAIVKAGMVCFVLYSVFRQHVFVYF